MGTVPHWVWGYSATPCTPRTPLEVPSVGCYRAFAFWMQSEVGIKFERGKSPSPCPHSVPTGTMAHPTPGRWQQHPAPHWKMPKSMGRDCAAAVPGLIPRSRARQCLADFLCPSPHTGRLNSSRDLPTGNDPRRVSPADSVPDAHGSSRKF